MLLGFDLSHLFLFPIQDEESRKHFLIGCLVCLAGFVIPILPWLVAAGYSTILIRQVLNGEKPHLVPWENWEKLFRDGAMLFGIRLVYSIPLFLLILPFFLMFLTTPFLPVLLQDGNIEHIGTLWPLFVLIIGTTSLLIMPVSLATGLIVPAAEIHAVDQDEFAAGFRIREWWPIFKKNWGGFVVALAIFYVFSMIATLAMQFMMFTMILGCLLPLLLPVLSMYYSLIQYSTFAQAYKEGKDKLSLSITPASAQLSI